MKEIIELIKRLEIEIEKTPTGELRNLLCDVNIVIHHKALDDVNHQRDILYSFISWYNSKAKVQKGEHIFTSDVDEFLK